MGENNSRWSNWQTTNLKNIQATPAAQFQKNKRPNPVFLPGEFHGQRSLAGCCARGCKRVKHNLATKLTTRVTITMHHALWSLTSQQVFIVYSEFFFFHVFHWVLKTLGTDTIIQMKKWRLAAAAAWLQLCPTLCDPIDGSPSGSTVPGILQAKTLEWVAISFSNARKWKVKVKSLSLVRLLATPWTAAYQAPPSMGFSRQEYWRGVPLPSLKWRLRYIIHPKIYCNR